MTTFALIAEGITDQVLIEHIIEEFYEASSDQEIYVNHIQPLRDATDESRATTFGGWEQVLEHCSQPSTISQSLSLNDYLVIQIDTDCGDAEHFGVPLTEMGIDRSEIDIISDTKKLLIHNIGELYVKNAPRFIFAITVHSLECWILPFHFKEKQIRLKNCESHLKRKLSRSGVKYIKDYDFYKTLTKPIKGNILVKLKDDENSLGYFLSSLPNLVAIE